MKRRTVLRSGVAAAVCGFLPVAAIVGSEPAALMLGQVQALRWEMGLDPLQPHPALMTMARNQVMHMRTLGFATHVGPHGDDPVARGLLSGYEGRIIGEALAESVTDPPGTMKLWRADDETRAVLLDPVSKDIGIAVTGGATRTAWWGLVSGAPA